MIFKRTDLFILYAQICLFLNYDDAGARILSIRKSSSIFRVFLVFFGLGEMENLV